MDHQKISLAMMEANEGLGLFLAMGLGKTAIALAYIYKHLKRGDFVNGVLVVCPASLIASWEQAINDMARFEGFDAHAVELLKKHIVIRSYQKTYKSTKIPIGRDGDEVTYKKVIELRPDVDKYWSCLIIDESHQCSAHKAAQTNAAITLAKLSARRYIMTGTPTHGGRGRPAYDKLYGQIQIITAGQAFRNWTDFSNKAVATVDKWYKPDTFNEEYCKKLMEKYAVVYRIEDCIDMPKKIEQDVPCPLVEKTIYTDLGRGDIAKYGLDIQNAGGQYTKMLQVCSGSMKVTDTSTMMLRTSKDDALGDILNGTDEPVVIFCNYRASIDHAAAVAKKAGRNVVVFDGRSKTETWRDFQAGRVDCIVCQYQSGGVGLNLQRSHIMVCYEPCFSSLLLTQALGRIYRKGQEHTCQYYYLVTRGTLEEKVFKLVRSGVDINDKLLHDLATGAFDADKKGERTVQE